MIQSFHRRFVAFAELLQHPVLLLIRLYWGFDFYQTGIGKLNNLERTADFFSSLNIPFPYFNAALAGTTEIVCGILLAAGLASRYVSIPLIVILMMAYATDDYEAAVNIISDVESFVDATPFRHLLAAVIILTFGAGKFSLDFLYQKLFAKKLPD